LISGGLFGLEWNQLMKMSNKLPMAIGNQLSKFQETYHNNISTLADEFRDKILIPLCSKKKLTFVSGMGRFFFSTTANIDINEIDDKLIEKHGLKTIFDILNIELTRDDYFGYYVSDISENDWK
jgi:hypothetical protein